ncbi:MAG: recombination regulator RecX [Lachnospiraceae bacterium]|nr:recombination regulator RecX [Lachnospiraceae bacterium]
MRCDQTARESALTMLERSDRTEKEIRQKLHEKGYEAEAIDEAVAFLKEYRYVNDAEYAAKYTRVYSTRKSIRQIRCELERRGVARAVIDEALTENDVDEEAQIRTLLLKKGYQPGERMEAAAYRKLTGALTRKGFSYEAIRRVTDRMDEEEY